MRLAIVLFVMLSCSKAFRLASRRTGRALTRPMMLAEHLDLAHQLSDFLQSHSHHSHTILADHTMQMDHSSLVVSEGSSIADGVQEAEKSAPPSPYSRVDNTGFIGGLASGIEAAIDFGHRALTTAGLGKNTYGLSILLFTCLVKAATLPLTAAQLESTTRMQAIAPFQAQITQKYAGTDEPTKNQLLAMLFQAANVNPLAGCLPALVQLPIFLSLYRALGNLIAQNKLSEPFLWIPDLEGPVYVSQEQTVESRLGLGLARVRVGVS